MITSAPKLRSDLTVRQQETNGERFFILKDPVSGEFFRFREAEQFIAEQFDGETPLEAVRKNTEEKFGATLPAETLNAFVKNLEKTGLLETEKTGKKGIDKRGRIRGSPLYLRFKAFDPDQLFNHLVPRVRFLFTPLFLVFSACLILLAVGELIANWSQFAQDISRTVAFDVQLRHAGIMLILKPFRRHAQMMRNRRRYSRGRRRDRDRAMPCHRRRLR